MWNINIKSSGQKIFYYKSEVHRIVDPKYIFGNSQYTDFYDHGTRMSYPRERIQKQEERGPRINLWGIGNEEAAKETNRQSKKKERKPPFFISEIEECFKKEGVNVDREKSTEFDPFEKFG